MNKKNISVVLALTMCAPILLNVSTVSGLEMSDTEIIQESIGENESDKTNTLESLPNDSENESLTTIENDSINNIENYSINMETKTSDEVNTLSIDPENQWKIDLGWNLEDGNYVKNIDNVVYQLFYGQTPYQQYKSMAPSWQVSVISSPNASGSINILPEIDGYPVRNIGNQSFSSNLNITEVIMPNSIEEIGYATFNNCENLTNINLSENIKWINDLAFYKCFQIKNMTIPETLEVIGRQPFNPHSSYIYFKGNQPEVLYGKPDLKNIIIYYNSNSSGWETEWPNTNVQPVTVEITSNTNEIKVNNEIQLKATVKAPDELMSSVIEWTTSDNNIASINNLGILHGLKAGTVTAYAKTENGIIGSYIFTIKDSLNTAKIDEISEQMYTGNEIKPKINVSINGEIISNDNYDVNYKNNINEGTAEVIIVGKNHYEGTISKTFKIKKLSIYNDVSKESWYYSYVSDVYSKKLMTGLNETKFGPNEMLTRSQFATILYRMEGSPNVEWYNKFPDVPNNTFYSKAVIWAANNGIVSGYENGRFGTSDNITREQLATMLYRYAKFKGYDTSSSTDLSNFPDVNNVSNFAKQGMSWCVDNKIISGDGVTKELIPRGNTVRAICATIISRFTNAF